MLITVATGAATLIVIALIYRPLLFSSLDEEVAEARGVRVGMLGIGFMLLMALAVSEAVQVSGVLLIFALLIAPGAIVERLIRRPFRALMTAAVLAVAITWASLALAYYTPYPVSFFVTSIAFGLYLIARVIEVLRSRSRGKALVSLAHRATPDHQVPEHAVSASRVP
jgi:zinc/manganese transport system permease protein